MVGLSVVEAVQRDLKGIARRDKGLAESSLAASALALAAELDNAGNSATSKSMCAKSLLDVMNRLRELTPEEAGVDAVDDLAAKRAKRLDGRATA